MSGYTDLAIVVKRTNYQEADRIIKFYTSKKGLVTVLAKGVRKQKSRLASSVEPFCLTEIHFFNSKSQLSTITSANVKKYYSNIAKDLKKQNLAADSIRLIERYVQDSGSSEYFNLLKEYLESLDNLKNNELCQIWWQVNFLNLTGHLFNLNSDITGVKLSRGVKYKFDFESGSFLSSSEGSYGANHIQLLRLLLVNSPDKLLQLKDLELYTNNLADLTDKFTKLTFE